jgi:hypothetical protein
MACQRCHNGVLPGGGYCDCSHGRYNAQSDADARAERWDKHHMRELLESGEVDMLVDALREERR